MNIDLGEIIKTKNPRLYKKTPRFVIWMARKLVHEKEINIILDNFSNLRGGDFNRATLNHLEIKREVEGLEELDSDTRYIFASNHPLGGLDGLTLIEAIGTKFRGVKIIVNDILMNLTPLKDLFLPVNKHGRQTSQYAKSLAEHLEKGKALIYFPAGLCSRKIKGEVTDLKWSKNFVQKAIEYRFDIVPTFVDALNSPLFYNIERFRRVLGIKFNIGMILLPHELFRKSKQRGSVRIVFGKPITYKELSTTHNVEYWCEEIRKRSYELGRISM